MAAIPITRFAYLSLYLDVLSSSGVPIERELERAKLPHVIGGAPDDYVSNILAVAFLRRCERSVGIEDLGFLAARRLRLGALSDRVRRALSSQPTLRAVLCRLVYEVPIEDSSLLIRVQPEGEHERIIVGRKGTAFLENLQFSDWLVVMALVEILRSEAGASWQPEEIAFRPHFALGSGAKEHFGNARILVGREHTSLLVAKGLLAAPTGHLGLGGAEALAHSASPSPADREGEAEASLVRSLRKTLRPYLNDGGPPLALAAEIAGKSQRTLQRLLRANGTSYRELVEHARFELAAEMLVGSQVSVTDVAYAVGYEHPSHFTRAFRRVSGVAPQAFRHSQPASSRSILPRSS